MQSRGKRPGKGHIAGHWTFEKVNHKDKWNAWIAGPVHGVWVHLIGQSKPCLRVICGTQAKCSGCENHIRLQWLGYLPLWRYDGKPVVVGVKEFALEGIERIPLHAEVQVSRGNEYHDAVEILDLRTRERYYSSLPDRQRPADLCGWLCQLWRAPELEPHLRRSLDDQAVAVDPLPDALPAASTMLGSTAWVDGVADALAKSEANVDLHELMKKRGYSADTLKPSTNGHGKKKKS